MRGIIVVWMEELFVNSGQLKNEAKNGMVFYEVMTTFKTYLIPVILYLYVKMVIQNRNAFMVLVYFSSPFLKSV